jgi:LruC domain-containing protein
MLKNIKLLSFLIIIGMAFSCSNKKKDIPLFLALLGGGNSDGASVTTASGTNTGVNAPEGSIIEQIDDTTVVIHFPTPSNDDSTESEESTTAPSTTVTTSNNDQVGDTEFNYQTSTTIPVNINVSDDNGPVAGAIVTIVDVTDPENPNILFQQVTDTSGTASGSVVVSTTTETIQANINLGDSVVSTTVPTTVTNPETGQVLKVITVEREIVVSGSHNPAEQFTDSDGDGIADAYDDYPDDPTRATLTRFPNKGVNTLAFEDLFPGAGDADLNDYVAFFSIEEDLNAQGKVVTIRGFYEHAARGAGYRHTLNMKLNVPTGATLSKITSKNRNNKTIQENEGTQTLSSSDLANGFEILGSSAQTISTPNVNAAHANNLKFGDSVNFEITFDQPVSKQTIGSAPYDVFLYVINTKKNIHLPGKYFNAEGKDIFMDSNGFPWAIIVPGKWKWQLEGQDIRKPAQTGYADFNTWAESKGALKKNWYTNVTNPSKVFPLPEESSLSGYLARVAQNNWLILALGLLSVGLLTGYFLTRKNQAILSR